MANQIKLKRGSGSNPGTSDLVVGEVALRTDNGTLFTKKDDGNIAEIGAATGVSDGDKGDITVSNSGATFTIDSGVIDNANVASNAAIAGSKISPTFSSQILVHQATAPQIRINTSSSDSSSTRFMFGLATASNQFINGSSSNDSCFSAPSNILFGIGNSRKFRIKSNDVLTDIDFIPSSNDATSLGRTDARWSDLFAVDGNISGNLDVGGNINLPDSTGSTVGRLMVGSDDDLQIFHNGNQSVIKDNGTGQLLISGENTIAFTNAAATENYARMVKDAAVELFFNNTKRIETTNAGATITGDATISQDLTVRGIAATGNFSVNNTNPSITLIDDSHNFKLDVNGNLFAIRDNTNADAIRFSIDDSGTVDVTGNLDVGAGLDVTGNITVTGNVDGRNVASDGSKLDGIASGATNVTNTNQLTNGAGFLTSVGTSNISDDAVTFAKMQHIGSPSFLGRNSSGTGAIENLSVSDVRTMLNVENGATADQSASEILTLIKTVDGSGSGLDADTLDGENSGAYLRSNVADQASGDITFAGGAGAVTIEANSDITFNNGSSWSGNQTKIAHHGNYLYIVGGSNGIAFRESGTNRAFIDGDGHLVPGANNTYDLGSNSTRWRNVYTSDLVLSNEGSKNDVDMTWGSFRIQEGHHDLFLINKRTGKKYKFNLTEVN